MADTLNVQLAPQFVVNIVHTMGGGGGLTIVAGIASTSSGGSMSDAEVKIAYENNADTNEFNDAEKTALGTMESGATADQTDGEIETAYNAQVAKISSGEITAGTEVTVRRVSPADLKAVVLAHETGGSGEPNPDQVSGQEITDGTETALRSFSPDDIEAMAQIHAGFPADPVITGKLSWLTDVILERDGAGILAQRDGANNQRQRWYAWYTDADNGEWGEYGWNGGVFYLGSFANGTGTGRAMGFITDGVARWAISATGGFAPAFDNVHDIGLSGSNRPKDMFLGGTLSLLNITANKPSMVISGYSLTGANAQNMIDLSGTWNTTGAPTLLYADVLDTASDAGAMLVNLKVGGVSMFSVTKAGAVTAISGLGGTMSDAQVKTAYENNADTNEFNDTEKSKLGSIEDSADVTDATNVGAAGAVMDGDITAGEGFLRKTGAGAYVAMKSNLGAATNPVVTSDTAAGYVVGSRWINTTLDTEYVCLDATNGAAVWTETTGAGGGGMSDAEVKTAYENNANTNAFTDAEKTSLGTMEDNATGDQSDSEIETAYNNQVPVVSAGEMTAGTEVTMRRFSPDNIENMIAIHGGGGGGGDGSSIIEYTKVELTAEDVVAANAAVVWDQVREFSGTVMWNSGDPTRLTANSPGVYIFGWSGDTTSNTLKLFPGIHDSLVGDTSDLTKQNVGTIAGDGSETGSKIWTITGSAVFDTGDYIQAGLPSVGASFDAVEGTNFWMMKITSDNASVDPLWTNTYLMMGANGSDTSTDFIDESIRVHTITASGGAELDTAVKKFGSAALLLTGTGHAVISTHTDFNFGSADFTLECWVNMSSEPGAAVSFLSKYNSTGNFRQWNFQYDTPTGMIRLITSTDGTATSLATFELDVDGISTAAFFDSNWHHVACVRDNGTTKVYVDGILGGGTWVGGNGQLQANNENLYIGARGAGTAEMTGSMDEIRITVGYARYTEAFTPSTIEFSRTGGGMSDQEVRTAVENAIDSNVFTDADHSKLDAIKTTSVNLFNDDHTLALTDAEDIVEMDKATANVLLIPTNAAVAFPIGTIISVSMIGVGITSITGDTGVTLNRVSAGSGEMTGQDAGVSLYQRATDVWLAQGAIGDVT